MTSKAQATADPIDRPMTLSTEERDELRELISHSMADSAIRAFVVDWKCNYCQCWRRDPPVTRKPMPRCRQCYDKRQARLRELRRPEAPL